MRTKRLLWIIAAVIVVCAVFAVLLNSDGRNGAMQGEVSEWFDMYDMYRGRAEFDFEYPKDCTTDAFPGARFVLGGEPGCLHVVEKDGNIKLLNYGMPKNAWLCDLTGDGKPELCATIEAGSGHVIENIIVYDYAKDKLYNFFSEPDYDFALKCSNGKLVAEKRLHAGPPGTGPLVARGLIMIKRGALAMENGETTEVEEFVTAQGYDYGYDGCDLEKLPADCVLITEGSGERYISLWGGYIYIMKSEDGKTTYKEYVQFRPNDSKGRNMSLDDVLELAKKGEALSIEDLKGYAFSEIGSGLSVRLYTLSSLFDTPYYLVVSALSNVYGTSLVYIPTGDSIDIRKEDPRAFLESHREPQIEETPEGTEP